MAATPQPIGTSLKHWRLDRTKSLDVFRAHSIGTLAFTLRSRATVEPVNYVVDPDFPEWIYVRTMPGSVLELDMANPWIALTVRVERSTLDWTQVMAYGKIFGLAQSGVHATPKPYARGIDLMATVTPTLASGESLFRISLDNVTGRACAPE